MTPDGRDHGGGLDAAAARFGGNRSDWIDLSTGINPVPYALPDLPAGIWTALPDRNASDALVRAARKFWSVPDRLEILAAPGASALIANLPRLADEPGRVRIDHPTYNEHRAAFEAAGWKVSGGATEARVLVHPNNPDGRWYDASDLCPGFTVIDESFCDVAPERSLVSDATARCVILKSFGKFWGLAGLRLGFVIGDPDLIARLRGMLGPWPVSGPALKVGAIALGDSNWADATRKRLREDAPRLDRLMTRAGAELAGGTPLFRLYRVHDAAEWQSRLASHRVWSRIFPWSDNHLRLGLPAPGKWAQIEAAL